MKSNITRKKEDRVISRAYDVVSVDVVHQTVACCLLYLEKRYGFDGSELKNCLEGLDAMMNTEFFGKEINPIEVIDYLKDTYGIDVNNMKVRLE